MVLQAFFFYLFSAVCVASAVMVAVLVWLGPETSWLLRLLLGIVTYGATLALIRGIPADALPARPADHQIP